MYCTVPVYTTVLRLLNYANTSFVQIDSDSKNLGQMCKRADAMRETAFPLSMSRTPATTQSQLLYRFCMSKAKDLPE